MKPYLLATLLSASLVGASTAQRVDTLIDVGGYGLHFEILPGTGTTILFEPGGTFDGPPWNGMLDHIQRVTGATVISYDRSGFGESELNPHATEPSEFGILNGMKELETALVSLEYDEDFVLVGHSYGAFYSALFAARHADRVKAVVLLNAQLPEYWSEERLAAQPAPNPQGISPGDFYLRSNFAETVQLVRENPIPKHIPIVDLVAGRPIFFMSDDDFAAWNEAHRAFAGARPGIEAITVFDSGHYIFKDNPVVFLNAVVRAYADAQPEERRSQILRRAIDETIRLANPPAAEGRGGPPEAAQ